MLKTFVTAIQHREHAREGTYITLNEEQLPKTTCPHREHF